MLSPQVLHLPHLLEDQFVWLSVGTWGLLLMWLRTRISRRRVLMWAGLAGALHLTPVAAQVIRATSAFSVMADDMPFTFWALQVINVLVLGMILSIWYLAQRRGARLRQVRAVMDERRRIANDLHDGVGSRLVALLASQDPKSSGPDSLAMALQACLLELQMTVDDLDDQSNATVLERLGHLRYRLRPAFERMGIVLEWNIAPEAQALDLPPETATQVCRVAQEALSNALRHSRAKRVELRIAALDRGRALAVEVRDDGRGMQAQAGGSPDLAVPGHLGKGLRSMHSRAEAIGGELDIMRLAPYGLCVRLVVPCKAVAPEPPSTRPEAESML
ncbi:MULTISPECIES: sensor histidine kinase [unclassified Variovorax]|uniref:sensor histidine kinase n=1 Tax=unclassified Variovorax TaxID=663243 RepID=UPI0008BDAD4C|nr:MULTISPECIES: ATP-binding protein [unclassified Variovorax]SEJ76944.1 Signal transduction histidine kinase [Variovorax sp. OK202]SFC89889.1 Signal transduction histidine kinase [Variovorax sp. OK212]